MTTKKEKKSLDYWKCDMCYNSNPIEKKYCKDCGVKRIENKYPKRIVIIYLQKNRKISE